MPLYVPDRVPSGDVFNLKIFDRERPTNFNPAWADNHQRYPSHPIPKFPLVITHFSFLFLTPPSVPFPLPLTTVEVDCDTDSMLFTVSDPSFAVREGGQIVAVAPVPLEKQGRTFSVRAQDGRGLQSQMEVRLICSKTNRLHKRQVSQEIAVCLRDVPRITVGHYIFCISRGLKSPFGFDMKLLHL